jgi:hypothetical protein
LAIEGHSSFLRQFLPSGWRGAIERLQRYGRLWAAASACGWIPQAQLT